MTTQFEFEQRDLWGRLAAWVGFAAIVTDRVFDFAPDRSLYLFMAGSFFLAIGLYVIPEFPRSKE